MMFIYMVHSLIFICCIQPIEFAQFRVILCLPLLILHDSIIKFSLGLFLKRLPFNFEDFILQNSLMVFMDSLGCPLSLHGQFRARAIAFMQGTAHLAVRSRKLNLCFLKLMPHLVKLVPFLAQSLTRRLSQLLLCNDSL